MYTHILFYIYIIHSNKIYLSILIDEHVSETLKRRGNIGR